MPENLELLRKLRGAHRGVATKLYNEADGILNKPFTLLNEDNLIQMQQIVELLRKKQAFLSEQNQKFQSLFDDPDNLDDEIVETEEYDDKICQNIDCVHRFVQRKTCLVTRELICSRKHHDFEKYTEHYSAEAQLAQFFRKLLGLDLVFRSLQGSSNR